MFVAVIVSFPLDLDLKMSTKEDETDKSNLDVVKSYYKSLTLQKKYGTTGSIEMENGAVYIGNMFNTMSLIQTGYDVQVTSMRMESGQGWAIWRYPMAPPTMAVSTRCCACCFCTSV